MQVPKVQLRLRLRRRRPVADTGDGGGGDEGDDRAAETDDVRRTARQFYYSLLYTYDTIFTSYLLHAHILYYVANRMRTRNAKRN